jgi:peptide-N4-(N-acetyl-beta-glucosaminyl)asparagine amidase
VRASGENAPAEVAACVTDGADGTKWLDFSPAGAWVEYRTVPPQSQVIVARYALKSADDAPERDPAHWALERYDEGLEEWVVMDERRGVRFARRGEQLQFDVERRSRAAAGRVRLRVVTVADPAAANSVQLACWELYREV